MNKLHIKELNEKKKIHIKHIGLLIDSKCVFFFKDIALVNLLYDSKFIFSLFLLCLQLMGALTDLITM